MIAELHILPLPAITNVNIQYDSLWNVCYWCINLKFSIRFWKSLILIRIVYLNSSYTKSEVKYLHGTAIIINGAQKESRKFIGMVDCKGSLEIPWFLRPRDTKRWSHIPREDVQNKLERHAINRNNNTYVNFSVAIALLMNERWR